MFRRLRLTRRLAAVLFLSVLVLASAGFFNAGHLLIAPRATEMPAPADAIIVLSGRPTDRWLEAYDLWRAELAPLIVMSRGFPDAGSVTLSKRGIRVPSGAEIARDVLIGKLGVPESAVIIIDRNLDNTATEGAATRDLAVARGWKRIIVVTSLPHTRRTAYVMNRTVSPAGVDVQVRATRYERFDPDQWWSYRAGWRWVITELPKLVAYRLGLDE